MMSPQSRVFLRLKEVSRRTTYSRTRIYELIQDGKFPAPIHLGLRAVAWLESDIDAWMDERIAATKQRASA